MKTKLFYFLLILIYFMFFVVVLISYKLKIHHLEEKNAQIRYQLKIIKYADKAFALNNMMKFYKSYEYLPIIYIITPTYARFTQLADLNRLKNTLLHVPKVFWVIVEDGRNKSSRVTQFLSETNIPHVHLFEESPKVVKQPDNTSWIKHKGVSQRNKAIKWLGTLKTDTGVVYFADDDNSYDIRLFEEMRYTKKISVWAVGTVGGSFYERPICKNDKVIGFFSPYNPNRKYPLDMASFAINLKLLKDTPRAMFAHYSKADFEGAFLKYLVNSIDDLEATRNNCSKIYVWHTKNQPQTFIKYNVTFESSIMTIDTRF